MDITNKDISNGSKTSTMLVTHSPSGLSDLSDQIRNSMITAQEVGNAQETHNA